MMNIFKNKQWTRNLSIAFFALSILFIYLSRFNLVFNFLMVPALTIAAVNGFALLFHTEFGQRMLSRYIQKMEKPNSKKLATVDLENYRSVFLKIGFVITLFMVIMAFTMRDDAGRKNRLAAATDLEDMEIEPPLTEQPPPKPPPPVIELEEVEDEEILEEEEEIEETEADEFTEIILEDAPPEDDDEEPIFTVVEDPPMFPGGTAKLKAYLGNNYNYPRIAVENNVEGKIFLTFVVNTDGSIVDVKLLKGLCPPCDKEAIRLVKSMPRWSPGKQRGKAVRVQFNLPIALTLN